MSAQRLNARSIRRIEQFIGRPVLRAWSHGGSWFAFVTPDHRHGWVHKYEGTVKWDENPTHYSSCRDTWP